MSLRVAVVGGGIGGLAAALWLQRAGVQATVYEQAPEPREVGAGIVVPPNLVRALRSVGLDSGLPAFAVCLDAAREFRRWQQGALLSVQPMGQTCVDLYGTHCYTAHRADLLQMLLQALPAGSVQGDRRCTAVRQEGGRVQLQFQSRDGELHTLDADVAIGADGIHSAVRAALVPPSEARFSGLSAFRCLVPAADAPAMALRPVQTLWLGPGRHFVHYPISAGRLVNVVAIVPAGDWRTESWTAEGQVADLAAAFDGWDPRVLQLIQAARDTRRWALYDRQPLERWSQGHLALLGDAAHAMLPFFAQGAAQAVEDAVVLAGCLQGATRDTAATALQRYESIRRPRANQVQLMSRGREVRNHLPDGPEQQQRDAELARGDPLRQSAWLYGHDATGSLQPS
jgi:salicylate hydroxylase